MRVGDIPLAVGFDTQIEIKVDGGWCPVVKFELGNIPNRLILIPRFVLKYKPQLEKLDR